MSQIANRRLVLCKEMLVLPFHYKGLDRELWELIWSYLNVYKHLWNAVNLEYRSHLTCRIGPLGWQYRKLRYQINGIQLHKGQTRETRIHVKSEWIQIHPTSEWTQIHPTIIRNVREDWYVEPITCRGALFDVCVNYRKMHIVHSSTGTPCSPRVSINSKEGRRLIAEYKLEHFFEDYIQPEGMDEPVEEPYLTRILHIRGLQEKHSCNA
jgi:hypothetical protein